MFKNKKFFILGIGKSGISAAKLLSKENHVLLTDSKNTDLETIRQLEGLGINVIITDNQIEIFNDTYDYLVKSPGISDENKIVQKAKKNNIPVLTELEVAYRYLPKDITIIGITGSNGKTTTTTITYDILNKAHLPVHMAGNIGYPLCDMIDDIKKGDILVIEVSSHQLVNLDLFKTDISVITNFSEVHLDFFKTYENYKKNKLRIFRHHTKKDLAILNYDDQDVVCLTDNLISKKIYFSSKNETDIFIKDDAIFYDKNKVIDLKDIRIKGMHNYENCMAAILVAKQFHISNETISDVLSDFGGVEHRMEFVTKLNGRQFYNDSKATNVKSTITALKSFDKKVILILGGLDRGHSFDELIPYLGNTKHIICYGETKERIKTFALNNNIDVTVVNDVLESVKAAYNISEEEDTILLSPACASWDQYKSFEERGNLFKEAINNLK